MANETPRIRLHDLSLEQLEALLRDVPADVSIDLLVTVEEFVERIGGLDAARQALEQLEDHRDAA